MDELQNSRMSPYFAQIGQYFKRKEITRSFDLEELKGDNLDIVRLIGDYRYITRNQAEMYLRSPARKGPKKKDYYNNFKELMQAGYINAYYKTDSKGNVLAPTIYTLKDNEKTKEFAKYPYETQDTIYGERLSDILALLATNQWHIAALANYGDIIHAQKYNAYLKSEVPENACRSRIVFNDTGKTNYRLKVPSFCISALSFNRNQNKNDIKAFLDDLEKTLKIRKPAGCRANYVIILCDADVAHMKDAARVTQTKAVPKNTGIIFTSDAYTKRGNVLDWIYMCSYRGDDDTVEKNITTFLKS